MASSVSFDDPLGTLETHNKSVNLNSLYCSHLWANAQLRNAIINAPCNNKNTITYCYTCKGKIRKYEVISPQAFVPHNHSTPHKETTLENVDTLYGKNEYLEDNAIMQAVCSDVGYSEDSESTIDNKQYIPSISQRIDSSFREKYVSYERRCNEDLVQQQQRLRKSLRGFGCVINFSSTDKPLKKRTQIQACSISVMIVAIVIISFILVNFTSSNLKHKVSTTIVPITNVNYINETSSAITDNYTEITTVIDTNTTEEEFFYSTQPPNSSSIFTIVNVLTKIRKNIRTFPKTKNKKPEIAKPKEIINRDLSQRFCSCQKNEICMLDEDSGTAICRKSIDEDDPTGCGGLCALETEACYLVDKARGVRVCRLLTLVTCAPDEWRCRNGLCVSVESRCDGSIQCYDRSDEMHCDCDLTKQFRCGNSISCFSLTKLCDGVIDCWDGYDEVNCTSECPNYQFTCTSGQCILASRFCDGLPDCADGSDEPDGCGGTCGAHEMNCSNHRCVPQSVRCDGHDNCGDSTDEMHCS